MTRFDLVVRSRHTVLPDGERPAAVCVRDGVIAAIEPYETRADAREYADLGETALLPGLIDTHVHVNQPGRTEWEGFATATRAAAAGGITTIVDMPLNSIPPTTTLENLAAKRQAAEGECFTDVGFWGGAVPANADRLGELHEAGVYGFKCFTSPSGVDEFPPLTYAQLRTAMIAIADFDGLLIVHAEDPGTLTDPVGGTYQQFLESRPKTAERKAIERVIQAAKETGCRTHILHLSAADGVAVIAEAQADGARITAETCPHYLTLTAEEVTGAQFKCCPPIREAANADGLWQGLKDGVISCVVSDHSPCTPDLKHGGFDTAWGGITSVQLGLPAVWTTASSRGFALADVVNWMARGPAELAGIPYGIAVGHDANLVAFAPTEAFTVDPHTLHHRHPITPYAGHELTGAVKQTWLRGNPINHTPHGKLIKRRRP